MRKVMIGATALIVLVFVGSVLLAGDSGDSGKYGKWFDMENCGMCKPFAEYDGLLDNVTWEHYPTSSGILTVTTVAKGFESKYAEAHEKMMAIHKKLMAGQKVQLCNACSAMSDIADESVNWEQVKTRRGEIMLVSSSDPEKVAELHKWASKSSEEMAKLTLHEGHAH